MLHCVLFKNVHIFIPIESAASSFSAGILVRGKLMPSELRISAARAVQGGYITSLVLSHTAGVWLELLHASLKVKPDQSQILSSP